MCLKYFLPKKSTKQLIQNYLTTNLCRIITTSKRECNKFNASFENKRKGRPIFVSQKPSLLLLKQKGQTLYRGEIIVYFTSVYYSIEGNKWHINSR